MLRTWAVVLSCAVAFGVGLAAQETRLDEFSRRLRLNDKEHRPKLDPIFEAAGRDTTEAAAEMVNLRVQMVNFELNNRQAELPKLQAAYRAAATKVAGIEARVMTEVLPLLQPRDYERVGEAFDFMAGFFQVTATPAAGGRGGDGGRGGAGGGGGRGQDAPR